MSIIVYEDLMLCITNVHRLINFFREIKSNGAMNPVKRRCCSDRNFLIYNIIFLHNINARSVSLKEPVSARLHNGEKRKNIRNEMAKATSCRHSDVD